MGLTNVLRQIFSFMTLDVYHLLILANN